MVGIVISAHGHLASELLATAELIVGAVEKCIACNIEPDASVDQMEQSLHAAIKQVDDGQGVLMLTDLMGGTPCTRGMALCRFEHLEVISGVNLPMLLKANALRKGKTLVELAPQVVEAVQGSIKWVTRQPRITGSPLPTTGEGKSVIS